MALRLLKTTSATWLQKIALLIIFLLISQGKTQTTLAPAQLASFAPSIAPMQPPSLAPTMVPTTPPTDKVTTIGVGAFVWPFVGALFVGFIILYLLLWVYYSRKKSKERKLLNKRIRKRNTADTKGEGTLKDRTTRNVSGNNMATVIEMGEITQWNHPKWFKVNKSLQPTRDTHTQNCVSQEFIPSHTQGFVVQEFKVSDDDEPSVKRVVRHSTGSAYNEVDTNGYMAQETGDGYGSIVNSTGIYDGDETAETANGKRYTSEAEMIDDVIRNNKANEIEMDDLVMDRKIGNGHFGFVFKAMWEGNVVVVKQLNVVNENDPNMPNSNALQIEKLKRERLAHQQEMEAEIILASSLPTHQNLVEIFGYVRVPFGIVMSYMCGDSVEKYVYRKYNKHIPTILELLIILRKAAAGLKHLHKYGLIHRDIACRNILLGKKNQKNRIDEATEVRISDFGLSRQLQNNDKSQQTRSNFGPIKWMAPESIKDKKYSKHSDVYMYGITMWEMFYGMEPYPNLNTVQAAMHVVAYGKRPKIVLSKIRQMPDGYHSLMEKCWHSIAKARPNFAQIINAISCILLNPVARSPDGNVHCIATVNNFNSEQELQDTMTIEEKVRNVNVAPQEHKVEEIDLSVLEEETLNILLLMHFNSTERDVEDKVDYMEFHADHKEHRKLRKLLRYFQRTPTETLVMRGYPKENNYIQTKLQLKGPGKDEYLDKQELKLVRKTLMISIGDIPFIASEMISIKIDENDKKIIHIEYTQDKIKYEIKCKTDDHSTWLSKTLTLYRMIEIKRQEKQKHRGIQKSLELIKNSLKHEYGAKLQAETK